MWTAAWQAAFAEVPRHLFIPLIYRRDPRGDLRALDGQDPAQWQIWLAEVYRDNSVITQLALGRFFLQLHLDTGRSDHYRHGDVECASVVADDGSWAELNPNGDGVGLRR